MREKLLELMNREKLKPGQLAEKLGANPAVISHILAGRNKPGFDLLQKILRCFPRVNPDWLLLDSDQLYRDESPATSAGNPQTGNSLPFGNNDATPERTRVVNADSAGKFPFDEMNKGLAGELGGPAKTTQSGMQAPQAGLAAPYIQGIRTRKNAPVERIVIFYTDQTFESFDPTAR